MQSIQRAINYIEANLLEDSLDNESVANHIYSSSANFQRTFRVVTGITVGEYIRCRRLSLAGMELTGSDIRVIDAALKYGYDTPESFTKAFVRFHGVTPSESRRSPGSLKNFAPIFLRIEIQGGYKMNTKMISNLPPMVNSWFGENYHFNGAARYVLGCLGEMSMADYSLFAGITGDIFVQAYPLNGEIKGDGASDYYLGLKNFPSVFEKVGYAADSFSERELWNNREYYVRKITDSIDRGIPIIWYHPGDMGAIVGYEADRNTFFFLSGDKTEPDRLVLSDDFFQKEEHGGHLDYCGWIVISGQRYEVSLKDVYREAIMHLPDLLTTKTDEYTLGAEAFRAWAGDIENGKFDSIKPEDFDGNFLIYEIFVVNLATNSGGCQSFLEKAQELNPDLSFLEAIRKQYRIMNYLWNGGHWIKDVLTPKEREEMMRLYGDYNLESLGGSFGCKLDTLQDKEKRGPIVKQLRRFADCVDEVVRVLDANCG